MLRPGMNQVAARPNKLLQALDRTTALERALVELLAVTDPWRGKRGTEHELNARKNAVSLVKDLIEAEKQG